MEGGSYSGCTISSPEVEGNPGRCNWAADADDERNWPKATTWPPPRSYACAFCRRGFKSAQALGGHMNVHRRDRALLRRQRPEPCPSAAAAYSPPYSVMIPQPPQPPPEFAARGGVFLLYPMGDGAVIAPALASPPSYLSIPVDSGAGRRSSESKGGEELDLELRLGR